MGNLNILKELKNNRKLLSELHNAEYLQEVCRLLPNLAIKTQYGVGNYEFERLAYKEDELVLLFKLQPDSEDMETCMISHFIGDQFIVSARQYLYAYRWYARA